MGTKILNNTVIRPIWNEDRTRENYIYSSIYFLDSNWLVLLKLSKEDLAHLKKLYNSQNYLARVVSRIIAKHIHEIENEDEELIERLYYGLFKELKELDEEEFIRDPFEFVNNYKTIKDLFIKYGFENDLDILDEVYKEAKDYVDFVKKKGVVWVKISQEKKK
jgi:DNA mismatch repair ATPase MutS